MSTAASVLPLADNLREFSGKGKKKWKEKLVLYFTSLTVDRLGHCFSPKAYSSQ